MCRINIDILLQVSFTCLQTSYSFISFAVALAKEETVVPEVAPNLDRYRKDRSFRYEDFAKRDREGGMNPFRAQVAMCYNQLELPILLVKSLAFIQSISHN